MTLTSSRISDEFQLLSEILGICPGFDIPFHLYPSLMLVVHRAGTVDVVERKHDAQRITAVTHVMRTRDAARYILRRWW